jgi:hypothetical protein
MLAPAVAAAQIGAGIFKADLTGAQQVPPSGSAATGFAKIHVAGSSIIVGYTFSGLSSSQVSAHIHGPASPGVAAPIYFTLTAPGGTSGTVNTDTIPIVPADWDMLRQGLWYIDIHSVDFPEGEIRGQLLPNSPFVARFNGWQEVPANASTAIGNASIVLNGAETQAFISYFFNGLGSNQTAAHVHGPALPGANGGILFDLGSTGMTTGNVRNLLFSITPTEVAQLKSGLFYVNVHSVNFPGGEIRGPLKSYNKAVDFDSDGRAEIGVYREGPSSIWYTLNHATNAFSAVQFGTTGDLVVPVDQDSDTKTDATVWRPSSGTFFSLLSNSGSLQSQQFGTLGDDARVSGNYNGGVFTDFAVWRPGAPGSQGVFHFTEWSFGVYRAVPFGVSGSDVTVTGDYDGDRVSDIAVYRTAPGIYYILRSALGFLGQQFGVSATDTLVPGDYDGDGKTDLAVFRFGGATPGVWYIWQSSTNSLRAEAFGLGTDSPVPADFDGDGRTDLAVTRTESGAYVWYILQSSNGTMKAIQFGAAGDFRLPHYLVR